MNASTSAQPGLFVSYAQNFEDVLLWRALGRFAPASYVDVGAQDPVTDSVSLAFYERGWRGLHVEPSPHYARSLRAARPDEAVVEAAVGRVAGEIEYFDFGASGFGTCDERIAAAHRSRGLEFRRRRVRSVTLDEVLDGLRGRDVHWLKVDVEGGESGVFAGWRADAVRPWIVVVEGVDPLTGGDTSAGWQAALEGKGYRAAGFDGLNHFFVAAEHADLGAAFRHGPTIADRFALSGTASAPFCDRLNARIDSVGRQLEEQGLAVAEYARNLRRWHNGDREAWAMEQAEAARYIESLRAWGKEVEAYAHSLEEERARLQAEIARLRSGMAGGTSEGAP